MKLLVADTLHHAHEQLSPHALQHLKVFVLFVCRELRVESTLPSIPRPTERRGRGRGSLMRKCMSELRHRTYLVCLRPMLNPITSATVTDFHSRSVPHVAGPLPHVLHANVLGKVVGRHLST